MYIYGCCFLNVTNVLILSCDCSLIQDVRTRASNGLQLMVHVYHDVLMSIANGMRQRAALTVRIDFGPPYLYMELKEVHSGSE